MIAAQLARDAVEEPIPAREITIRLLNEIRKYCNGCGTVSQCACAKSAGALQHCKKIKDQEPDLRKLAGCP
jgi:hypothetical protein